MGDGARRDITAKTVSDLAEHLDSGDVIIDGGNSYYRDDIARAEAVRAKGIHYVDVGTSGGVWGLGPGTGLLPDDRRGGRSGRAAAADLRGHRSGNGSR